MITTGQMTAACQVEVEETVLQLIKHYRGATVQISVSHKSLNVNSSINVKYS